jgi:hypothetical protein
MMARRWCMLTYQFLHIEARFLQFLDCGFGCRVGFIDRHDSIVFSYHIFIFFRFVLCR